MKRLAKAAGVLAALAAIGFVLERRTIASPPYEGPPSDHFDGKRFRNREPHPEGSVMKWMMNRQLGPWRKWVESRPGPPPAQRVAEGIRVTWVNHATILVQMDGVNFLTDPIWSERTSPVSFAGPKRHRPPGLRFEDLPPIDAVLVSHNHYDHLDLPTLRRLGKTRIVTPLGNSALMARHGVPSGHDLDWWQSVQITDRVKVTLVPAQHFCSRGMSDRDRTLWGGFVISGPSGHAFFAGDTGWGTHFKEIGDRFQPMRLAMLPIGAYLPRWFMKRIHIDPAEAVDAHYALRAQTSMAMHFGTWDLGDDGEMEPVKDLQQALAAKGNPRFVVLEHGVGYDVE
ncbi:MAG TPA: MBL fold metallo-hydrolase [Thermoanaerobaculia bacterium]|jgi:L-ascorbate metabolism protein UlaG (beta-lactamase superfamily)